MTWNARKKDEFYVGYAARAPRGVARATLGVVSALVVLGAAVCLVLVFGQQPFPKASFEYQQYRDFEGRLEASPYPALLVERPGSAQDRPSDSRYLLVAPGKHGAEPAVSGLVGHRVHLRGSLLYRDGQTMIELLPGSLQAVGGTQVTAAAETVLGPAVLAGELVDSKCYLGAMNPGRTKVHKDCAVRCLSGGIPAMLLTNDTLYLLVGADGRKLSRELREIAGEPVEVHGNVARYGETLILKAEPSTFRPLKKISRIGNKAGG